jgi:protein-histidine pros-kinase
MSHELRTPLNGILGFAEILKEGLAGPLNENQFDYAGNILKSGKQLLHLVNEILDMAKIEADSLVLEESEFPLHLLIAEVIKSTGPLHKASEIQIDTQGVDRDIILLADRRRIWQVLLNLLGNSIKFTGKGGLISFHTESGDDGCLFISVSDNGIGIPETDLQRIFGRFEQVNDRKRAAKGGTGIGLALVKSVVELHGGRVWAAIPGIDGRGVKFTIQLPSERRCSGQKN